MKPNSRDGTSFMIIAFILMCVMTAIVLASDSNGTQTPKSQTITQDFSFATAMLTTESLDCISQIALQKEFENHTVIRYPAMRLVKSVNVPQPLPGAT